MRRFHGGRKEYLSFQVRNAAGDIVLRAHDAPSAPYDQVATPGFSTAGDYRLFTDTDETTGLTITVAETTQGRWEAVLGGARGMLWPLIALIPLNVLAIWLAVRGAMKPVKRLSGDIAARGGHNLAPLDISDVYIGPFDLSSGFQEVHAGILSDDCWVASARWCVQDGV